MYALLLLFVLHATPCDAFLCPSSRTATTSRSRPKPPPVTGLGVATRDREAPETTATSGSSPDPSSSPDNDDDSFPAAGVLRLEARASSGIRRDSDLPLVLDAIASTCEEYGIPLDAGGIECDESPARSESVPGALGRVLLLSVKGLPPSDDVDFDLDENEILTQLKIDLSERIDATLMSMHGEDGADGGSSDQPILLAFRPEGNDATAISDVIDKEAMDYGLRDGVEDVCSVEDEGCFVHPMRFEINCYPSSVVEIDGAMIDTVESPGQTRFDTSSILVFDKLLDKSLRRRLLNVVKGYPEDHSAGDDDWDDARNGPDPNRWVRGGLTDVVADEGNDDDDEGGSSSCWGLVDDAVLEICQNDHPAIAEFESKLANLFPDFVVTRLPESVLGGCVSPLTANAPTHGDEFHYHIDADPMQVPPSPWADVFGRYPNRSRGKPRFVSCLLYLNDEWDAEEWGAPTQFLDPPTRETFEVLPKAGRCVVMDQDISHRVVAPDEGAGRRPRYSLVWKLILHPMEEGQDMDLACGRKSMWPEPVVVGSASELSLL